MGIRARLAECRQKASEKIANLRTKFSGNQTQQPQKAGSAPSSRPAKLIGQTLESIIKQQKLADVSRGVNDTAVTYINGLSTDNTNGLFQHMSVAAPDQMIVGENSRLASSIKAGYGYPLVINQDVLYSWMKVMYPAFLADRRPDFNLYISLTGYYRCHLVDGDDLHSFTIRVENRFVGESTQADIIISYNKSPLQAESGDAVPTRAAIVDMSNGLYGPNTGHFYTTDPLTKRDAPNTVIDIARAKR